MEFEYNLSERDKGWLEGIIDGEGCLSLRKRNRKKQKNFQWQIIFSISNTDLRVCEKIKKLFTNENYIGGSIYQYQPKNKNSKMINIFNVKIYAMKKMLPLLKLISKDRQRQIFIEVLNILENSRINTVGYYRRPKEIDNKIENLYKEIIMLNKKGK
jgi:hypothetical protein